ncbi:AfsR/SARP family transcriptional regulator [Streptomyces sp. NPDC025273]|uniref:AfsR/SARP family transcriptional regulator n=1 Tax=unclassified Streptomyces TaxID=2593676 RepID=UPI003406DF4B
MPERTRRLLAALAWRPAEFVSDEEAVEQIWGEDRPQRPRDALYTCATRLRRAFGHFRPGAAGPVIRRTGGYVLAIDPSCVDLRRARRLIVQAHGADRLGDLESALALYDSALELWSAVPLSGLGSSWASAARVALERERHAASVGRLRIALQLGRHLESAPALHQLAADHPFDEVVAEMLMLALHRSGRQNEALDCFHTVRSLLVEQLGDEPGPALQELHRKVLCRDDSLGLRRDSVVA